jgi:hypothetical protein
MIERLIIWCIVVPVVITLAALIPAWKPWRPGARPRAVNWLLPVVMGAAYVTAHFGLREDWSISIPPTNARMWIVLAIPVMLVASLASSSNKSPVWLRMVLIPGVFAAFYALFLQSQIQHTWPVYNALAWIAGLAIGSSLYVCSLTELARRLPIRAFIFPWGLHTAIAAGTFGIMGAAQTAMQTGAMASILGTVFVICVWKGDTRPMISAALIPGFLLLAQLSEVFFFSYAENPIPSSLLIMMAPSMMWMILIPGLRSMANRHPLLRTGILTLLVLAPTFVAAGLAYRDNIVATDSYMP